MEIPSFIMKDYQLVPLVDKPCPTDIPAWEDPHGLFLRWGKVKNYGRESNQTVKINPCEHFSNFTSPLLHLTFYFLPHFLLLHCVVCSPSEFSPPSRPHVQSRSMGITYPCIDECNSFHTIIVI